jgi:flagellar biosynthesis protein FliP
MAEHSKVAAAASQGLLKIIINAFIGSTQRKAFSSVLLAIIGFLIYMKNKKSSTDNLRVR